MNKENNKSAAGLRRSALAERIQLREEWSALKGMEPQQTNLKQKNILTKKHNNAMTSTNVRNNLTDMNKRCRKPSTRNMHQTNDTLCGVVALVEVGSEGKALPLRAALSALGATVLLAWSPLVTHLIWTQGGCRATRARGRALACRLVSPLWVEACAAASRRLPEQAFPAAARASDLPSPTTLRRLLKKAEMENINIGDLLSDSNDENQKMLRLRISSETERDTSADTSGDTSLDKSTDRSRDTSNDAATGVKSRVNTAPRRALPMTESMSPAPQAKSRRKLFTQTEADLTRDTDVEEEEERPPKPIRKPSFKPKGRKKVVPAPPRPQIDRKGLARAERLARRLVAGSTPARTASQNSQKHVPRIVLTGMSRSERRVVTDAVRSLKGRVQPAVDRRTTHVVLGTFLSDQHYNNTLMTGVPTLSPSSLVPPKPRTVAALEGGARGCRVVYAPWALHSREKGRWLHHCGYEVKHLRNISQNARVERAALRKQDAEYAYDVFCGMRVRVARDADSRAPAVRLLHLCGAIVQDETDNDGVQKSRTQQVEGPSQYYVTQHPDVEYDVKIGRKVGDVTSRWVFDSVASARMRTTRRYIVKQDYSDDPLLAQLQRLGC